MTHQTRHEIQGELTVQLSAGKETTRLGMRFKGNLPYNSRREEGPPDSACDTRETYRTTLGGRRDDPTRHEIQWEITVQLSAGGGTTRLGMRFKGKLPYDPRREYDPPDSA